MNNSYITTTETTALIFNLLMLVLIISTKPKRTILYKINLLCIISSTLLLVTEHVLEFAMQVNPLNHLLLIDLVIAVTVAMYLFTLACLVVFVNRLSDRPIFITKYHHALFILVLLVWAIGAYYMSIAGWMYTIVDGKLYLYMFIPYIVLPGLIAGLGAGINAIVNRKHIPRPIFNYLLVFTPLDLTALFLQFMYHKNFFMALTHVLPCFLFYVVFHASGYDAYTGAMSRSSFETAGIALDRKKRPFTVIYVYLTKFENVDLGFDTEYTNRIQAAYRETCRKLEALDRRINVYRLNATTFASIISEKDSDKKEKLIEDFVEIIRGESKAAHMKNSYKINIYEKTSFTDTTNMVISFAKFLYNKSMSIPGDLYYATNIDYEEYVSRYRVEQLLYSIRNSNDLDSENIQVLIQPIYSVKDQCFKTGESLMRLLMDGKMVYPDVFIPIAERTGTIHFLTLIMINKVCKIANEISEKFDFDAITINCSSTEVANENFCDEVLNLIEMSNTPKSKIRLELTESAIFEDYGKAMDNIMNLNKAGILFYLDDFGTGYSNFERITSCPFHTIKFDKSILKSSIENEMVAEVIATMIDSFKKRGYRVLIEGVETKDNLEFCIKQGYEYVQGYYFSKPTSVTGLEEILISQGRG